jgi:hypothetical protein
MFVSVPKVEPDDLEQMLTDVRAGTGDEQHPTANKNWQTNQIGHFVELLRPELAKGTKV